MIKKVPFILLMAALFFCFTGMAHAVLWGINPGDSGNELINIDPWTGAVIQTMALPSIGPSNTEIGLAGAGDENKLYYVNSDENASQVWVFDPASGTVVEEFNIDGGWEVDGLGYWSGPEGEYIYTSGCSVTDIHRYNAEDGSNPTVWWTSMTDVQSMAGDIGNRIFTYGLYENRYGIYEVDPLNQNAVPFFIGASPSENIVGMAYDGNYLYLSDADNYLYIMNDMGEVVNTTKLDYTLYALGATVPEPSTVLLLGAGLIGIVAIRRRKK